MLELVTSTARVATTRPARYAKQLARSRSTWAEADFDDVSGRGQLVFAAAEAGAPAAVCDILCGDGVLVLAMEAPAGRIDAAENAVSAALRAQGDEEPPQITWVRAK